MATFPGKTEEIVRILREAEGNKSIEAVAVSTTSRRRVITAERRSTVAYGYDNRNELNIITEPGASPFADQNFTFDAAINRSNWTSGTTSINYTINNLNQYMVHLPP